MIRLDFDKVPDLVSSEEFRNRIIESMKTSAKRHGEEIKRMRSRNHEITSGDFECRADLMIMRCEYLIAKELGTDFESAEDGEQMSFVYHHREYLFTLLQRIITLETVDKALGEMRAKK